MEARSLPVGANAERMVVAGGMVIAGKGGDASGLPFAVGLQDVFDLGPAGTVAMPQAS
jgi:hypothetical protein